MRRKLTPRELLKYEKSKAALRRKLRALRHEQVGEAVRIWCVCARGCVFAWHTRAFNKSTLADVYVKFEPHVALL